MKIQNKEGELTAKDLPKVNPLKMKDMGTQILSLVNNIEPYPTLFPGKENPKESERGIVDVHCRISCG